MPKIFLIKNRLHQQQQRLLESQNLLQDKTDDDRLVPPLSPPPHHHHHSDERSTSPHYHRSKHPAFPNLPEPEDFPRSRNTNSPLSNIASTSDSLKALHIQSSLARSRSQSPIAVLDLHKKSTPQTSGPSKWRATEDYEGDEEEQQPLSLVSSASSLSSLTYLGRKRFHHYHRNLRNVAASAAVSSSSPAATETTSTNLTATTDVLPVTEKNVDNEIDNNEKEENNEGMFHIYIL